jgi:hypothetical protein
VRSTSRLSWPSRVLPSLEVIPSRQDHGQILRQLIRPSFRDDRHELVKEYSVAGGSEMESCDRSAVLRMMTPSPSALTVRKERPEYRVLIRSLRARQRCGPVFIPARFPHHGTPHIASLHAFLLCNTLHSFRVLSRGLSSASQAVVAGDVATVGGTQHTLIDRRRRDEDDAEVRTVGKMRMREDGVEVGGECVEWDVLLRATWSVWEARVIGALMGGDVSQWPAWILLWRCSYRRRW